MEYRPLGRTGLNVSQLCLGTMQWGWTADEEASRVVMDAFVEAGGNFIDTADMYSNWVPGNPGGVSEEIIGRWVKDRANRLQVVLATKVRGPMWEGPNGEGLSRARVLRCCEDSLRRLQTDYLDLYQLHWPDEATPIEETLAALDQLVREGKVCYVGCSNFSAWRSMEALWASDRHGRARFQSTQPHYNLVHRAEFERERKAVAQTYGLAVMPYSPLASGFLTGKYRKDATLPKTDRAAWVEEKYMNPRNFRVLEQVVAIAGNRKVSPAQVALAWLLHQPVVTSPIIGANTTEQLNENLGATRITLTPEERQALDDVSAWE